MNAVEIVNVVTQVVGVASIVAAALPVPKAQQAAGWLGTLRKILDVVAANVGNAKNAQPVDKDVKNGKS